jgi:hypothetical protein
LKGRRRPFEPWLRVGIRSPIVPIRTYRYNGAWQEGRISRRRRLGARLSLAIEESQLNSNRSQAQAWQRNSVPSSSTASTTG